MNNSKDLKDRILQMREENSIEILNDIKVTNDSKKVIDERKSHNNDNKDNFFMQKNKSLPSKDQEAFKILANKFNEAVGVILELTTRVEKLETLVRIQSMQNHNSSNNTEKYISKKSYIKYFIMIILILGFLYFFNYSEFDISIISKIFNDYSKILK